MRLISGKKRLTIPAACLLVFALVLCSCGAAQAEGPEQAEAHRQLEVVQQRVVSGQLLYPGATDSEGIETILTRICLEHNLAPRGVTTDSAKKPLAGDGSANVLSSIGAKMTIEGDLQGVKAIVDEINETDYIRVHKMTYNTGSKTASLGLVVYMSEELELFYDADPQNLQAKTDELLAIEAALAEGWRQIQSGTRLDSEMLELLDSKASDSNVSIESYSFDADKELITVVFACMNETDCTGFVGAINDYEPFKHILYTGYNADIGKFRFTITILLNTPEEEAAAQ